MTMSLYWLPVQTDGKPLSDKLKFALRKRYGGHVEGVLSERDVGYLSGLVDAGIEEAQTLIDAIDKHGEIKVFEQ